LFVLTCKYVVVTMFCGCRGQTWSSS